jgi:hypothetical protein
MIRQLNLTAAVNPVCHFILVRVGVRVGVGVGVRVSRYLSPTLKTSLQLLATTPHNRIEREPLDHEAYK